MVERSGVFVQRVLRWGLPFITTVAQEGCLLFLEGIYVHCRYLYIMWASI